MSENFFITSRLPNEQVQKMLTLLVNFYAMADPQFLALLQPQFFETVALEADPESMIHQAMSIAIINPDAVERQTTPLLLTATDHRFLNDTMAVLLGGMSSALVPENFIRPFTHFSKGIKNMQDLVKQFREIMEATQAYRDNLWGRNEGAAELN